MYIGEWKEAAKHLILGTTRLAGGVKNCKTIQQTTYQVQKTYDLLNLYADYKLYITRDVEDQQSTHHI